MRTIQKFRVKPTLPDRLQPLLDLAHNLWWTWNPDAVALFERIDPNLWHAARHNPVKLLAQVPQERLDDLAREEAFLAHLDRVVESIRSYLASPTWYSKVHKEQPQSRIAYFSAEFGLHESLPLYAGGLGVLAGDHLKSASELGLPLIGVGLLYRCGYFHQQLERDGTQTERSEEIHFSNLPLTVIRRPGGIPELISIDLPQRKILARVWRVQVGRVPLLLLDTDIAENEDADRRVTRYLYDADMDVRLRQEIVLGVGGLRALECCDVLPTVCHLNEGHSAFLSLERLAILIERYNLSFDEAKEAVAASSVFTTHTPVPAGNDVFPPDLVLRYLGHYCDRLGITPERLLDLGRSHPGDSSEPFSTTVLALKLSSFRNGVSALHGHVARRMWMHLWPNAQPGEVPITHVTNGVHLPSWYSDEMARLFDRYLGPDWLENPVDQKVWQRVGAIPDSELWRARERLRTRLVAEARSRLREQLERRGLQRSAVNEASEVLDPDTLTICFARRFATYKRATLLLRDLDRLASIVNDPERPVQFIFAGKAHPKDEPGKQMIRELIAVAERPEFRRRLVFLEDYDIDLARTMVQGADVWLNTPRRPLEASGTSGMKVAVNGGLNLSILDGWWDEAYNGKNGWAITPAQIEDPERQDAIESAALYDLLEQEVIPLFYSRGTDGLPREWIARMKESMSSICPRFNTNRAAEEYTKLFYIPSIMNWNWLLPRNMERARRIAAWKEAMRKAWTGVAILDVQSETHMDLAVGDTLEVTAKIRLDGIEPSDVKVEIVYGRLEGRDMVDSRTSLMSLTKRDTEGGANVHLYSGVISCHTSGHFGFSVRVTPRATELDDAFDRELISWWDAGVRKPGLVQR